MERRHCLRTLTRLTALLAVAVAPSLSGCLDRGQGGEDGQGPEILDRALEPGELIEIDVSGVDYGTDQILLWIGDQPVSGTFVEVLEHGSDDASSADDKLRFKQYVPPLVAGTYEVALGTAEHKITDDLAIEVVLPPPAMTRAQVVDTVTAGLGAMLGEVDAVLNDPDPDWNAFANEVFEADGRAALDEVVGSLGQVAQGFGEEYAQLSDDEERSLQAFLLNSGVLGLMEDMVVAESLSRGGAAPRVVTLADRLHHPVHRVLFSLDFAAMSLNVASHLMTDAALIALVTGIGAPIAAAVETINVVFTGVILVLDNFVPTDLVALEAHDQRSAIDREHTSWAYWGTFRPQNGALDSVVSLSSFLPVLAAEGGKAIPGSRAAIEIIGNVVSRLLGKAPGLLSSFANLEAMQFRFVEVKTLVNMQAYDITVGDLALAIPVLGPIIKINTAVSIDFELDSPFDLDTSDAPEWAEDASYVYRYTEDSVRFDNIDYPEGVGSVTLRATATARRWKTRDFILISLPSWENVVAEHEIVIHDNPVPEYAPKRDESFIILNRPNEDIDGWIGRDTSKDRTYDITFRSIVSGPSDDNPVIAVQVNGETVIESLALPSIKESVTRAIALRPGANELTLIGLDPGGGNEPNVFDAATMVELPDAANNHADKPIMINAGDSQSVRIFTPPEVE